MSKEDGTITNIFKETKSFIGLIFLGAIIFAIGYGIHYYTSSSEYELLLLECINLDGEKIELTIDVSEPTTNIAGGVLSVSEKNGVINLDHENEGTVFTLMPRLGKVSAGGRTMNCIFRDAQGVIVSGTIKQEESEILESEKSEPAISSLSQGGSPIFDVFYVWDIRFNDFYGKNRLTPSALWSLPGRAHGFNG